MRKCKVMYEQGGHGYMTIAGAKKSRIEYRLKNAYSGQARCHEAQLENRQTDLASIAQ
jgi:hypothetical protein